MALGSSSTISLILNFGWLLYGSRGHCWRHTTVQECTSVKALFSDRACTSCPSYALSNDLWQRTLGDNCMVQAFTHYRLDCNALLHDRNSWHSEETAAISRDKIMSKRRPILSTDVGRVARHLVSGTRRRVLGSLHSIHWLLVRRGIIFKTPSPVRKCINGFAHYGVSAVLTPSKITYYICLLYSSTRREYAVERQQIVWTVSTNSSVRVCC